MVDLVDRMYTNDERIAWVLKHSEMSPWLKAALAAAIECPPVEVQNDLEILNLLLRTYITDGLNDAGNDPQPM